MWKMAARARLFRIFGSFCSPAVKCLLLICQVFCVLVRSRVRFAEEAFPRCRTGFSAWRRRLSGGAIRSFRGHGRGFPVLQNRFRRVVKATERTFYPHFSVFCSLFLRICNVNSLISVNTCMISRHGVCCAGAFPQSWRVRSSAVQPELR